LHYRRMENWRSRRAHNRPSRTADRMLCPSEWSHSAHGNRAANHKLEFSDRAANPGCHNVTLPASEPDHVVRYTQFNTLLMPRLKRFEVFRHYSAEWKLSAGLGMVSCCPAPAISPEVRAIEFRLFH